MLSALVSGALLAGTLNGAPTAKASCVSFFGLSSGDGCRSNLTSFAIAIGPGAQADATYGLFGGALAIGANSLASNNLSILSLGAALGNGATASAVGSILGAAAQLGTGAATTGGALNLVLGASPATEPSNEIGRASCRERVYVLV